MSAMKVIDEISDKGGKMLLFESCGVLLHQSQIPIVGIITWPPRNVVLAGQGWLNLFRRGQAYTLLQFIQKNRIL
jgi:hypothetical protein